MNEESTKIIYNKVFVKFITGETKEFYAVTYVRDFMGIITVTDQSGSTLEINKSRIEYIVYKKGY